MKKIVFCFRATVVYSNNHFLGHWTDANYQKIYDKLTLACETLDANGYIQIIDEGLAENNQTKWTILTQLWAYHWAKSWRVAIKQATQWLEINDSVQWCERRCYGLNDKMDARMPIPLVKISVNQQDMTVDEQSIWSISEEYLYGCQLMTYVLTNHCQLTILKLRSVGTQQWLGQRITMTTNQATPMALALSNLVEQVDWTSNGQLRQIGQQTFYVSHDRLVLETRLFKEELGQQRGLWHHYWQLFAIAWEKDYRWARLYQRLMYEIYLRKSIQEIQDLLWAPPLDVTGDFACLAWQCDWQPVLTGFWRQLIGGHMIDGQLVIVDWPQLPLSGKRELTIHLDQQKFKIRLTEWQMALQPSKPLSVVSQQRQILCPRQCWTVIWQNG